jgi:hypothetical protein
MKYYAIKNAGGIFQEQQGMLFGILTANSLAMIQIGFTRNVVTGIMIAK